MKLENISQRKKIAAISLPIILVLIAILLLTKHNPSITTFDEVAVERGDIEPTVLSTGAVAPENRLEIKPPIAGRIIEVLVVEGDMVKKGQPLIKMSSTDRAALIDAAKAQGETELKKWETYYKPAFILAPLDGQIIVKNAQAGQTVTNNDVILVMSDRLTVQARVDETDIGSIKVAQKADIILDAYPDDIIPASVDKIAYDSKTISNVTTYIVDVLPDQVPKHMRSGMTANVVFHLDIKENILALPNNAVQIKSQRKFVLLPPISKPVEKDVTTGISDGTKIEITGGLDEGEQVLIQRIKWISGGNSQKSNPFLPNRPKAKKSK